MRYLTLNEVLETYSRVMQQSGGAVGIHTFRAIRGIGYKLQEVYNAYCQEVQCHA